MIQSIVNEIVAVIGWKATCGFILLAAMTPPVLAFSFATRFAGDEQ